MRAAWILLWLVLSLTTPCLASPKPGAASPAPVSAASLVGSYQGTFQWDGSPVLQPVRFTFERQTGNRLEGHGLYYDSGTRIQVEAVINPDTHQIEIRELSPQGPNTANFTISGIHQGTYAPDYSRVDARWKPAQSGEPSGTLRLGRVR